MKARVRDRIGQRAFEVYSLVHPVRGGFEPLDDLVVVECDEDSGDETDDKYDVVPWTKSP